MTVTSGNQLVECQECHNLYHQDCHKPQVTDKDVNDPRLVWYCARCTRQMKRMVRYTQGTLENLFIETINRLLDVLFMVCSFTGTENPEAPAEAVSYDDIHSSSCGEGLASEKA